MQSVYTHTKAAPDAGGTKERIQQVALELFVLHGYEKTSLREIADRLGITKAALYYHYASKQDLLKSVTQPLIDEFEAMVHADPPAEELLRSYIDLLYRHRAVFQLVANDHSCLAAAELVERSVQLRRDVVRQLAGPDPRPADYVRAAAAFGAISQGFMVARRAEPAADPAVPDLEAAAEAAAGLPGPADYPDGAELARILLDAALAVLRPGSGDRGISEP
ncbi:TetR/AcrR family transcriptional regulator [Catenulispora sp. NL8]|uniref:TetR/AcrR family transcriptional regulator n=1 Tax=Catenulispora pinistramenti TaxID=2705254 RepID=A0ABS5KR23_9ACTN|nr:TetR/AcrR family transcriptional regulator [Catenulispora pinistramenti]MBS2548475.1 TetR/AcrR family transcriptional regulator [Catenulispora pinistramenti]